MPTPTNLPIRGQALWREDWDQIIEQCRLTPNEVGVVLRDRPTSRAKSLNTRRKAPFVTPEGRLYAYMRNTYLHESGVDYCDMHVAWRTD